MNADRREQVRANARYLRGVRPLDPAEIGEYVTGGPHPAAVRAILRDLAPELGVVERDDGTFVPVSEGPIEPGDGHVSAFPERYARAVEDRLVDRFGPDWHRGGAGDRLRDAIRAFKRAYLAGDPVDYDRVTALGYAVYHLPDYYATARYVVDDLARDGLLDRRLRVLDVGAGVGGPALGIADAAPDDALVDYEAVEPSDAAADLLESLLGETGRNVHATIHRTTAEAFADERGFEAGAVTPTDPDDGGDGGGEPGDGGAGYDVVLFANVLSELDEPAATAARYGDALAPDGSLVAVAPADRETSVGLRRVERALADGGPLTVHSPTVRLWPGERPTDECWAFDAKPDLDVPPFQARLDDGSGTFVNVDVQFSHAVLRRDGRRRIDWRPDPARWTRMADAADHVTDRIDVLGAKLSRSLVDRGEEERSGTRDSGDPNPVYRVSDGSESTGHFAVLVDESGLNRTLREAPYGALLAFEGALLLWNDDEAAYNLVVDGETIVDRVA